MKFSLLLTILLSVTFLGCSSYYQSFYQPGTSISGYTLEVEKYLIPKFLVKAVQDISLVLLKYLESPSLRMESHMVLLIMEIIQT